jgi:hypothetical protein
MSNCTASWRSHGWFYLGGRSRGTLTSSAAAWPHLQLCARSSPFMRRAARVPLTLAMRFVSAYHRRPPHWAVVVRGIEKHGKEETGGRLGKASTSAKKQIEAYTHSDERWSNNPPVGLVTPATDPPDPPKKTRQYDPHLDPHQRRSGQAGIDQGVNDSMPTTSHMLATQREKKAQKSCYGKGNRLVLHIRPKSGFASLPRHSIAERLALSR